MSLGTPLENGEGMKPSPLVELNSNIMLRDVERMWSVPVKTHLRSVTQVIQSHGHGTKVENPTPASSAGSSTAIDLVFVDDKVSCP